LASTTLTNFRLRVAAILGLDNSSNGDQGLIDAWVNEGYEDFVRRTQCNVDEATMALTSGTDDYTIATSIMAILEIDNSASDQTYGMERLTLPDLLKMRRAAPTTASPARYYAFKGSDRLSVFPTPGSSETLTILYVPRPTALSAGSDVPSDVPAEFHQALEYYALHRGGEYDNHGPSQFGAYWMAKYEKAVQECRQAMRQRGGSRAARAQVGRATRYVNRDPSVITY
jgi:hypothetical protein